MTDSELAAIETILKGDAAAPKSTRNGDCPDCGVDGDGCPPCDRCDLRWHNGAAVQLLAELKRLRAGISSAVDQVEREYGSTAGRKLRELLK